MFNLTQNCLHIFKNGLSFYYAIIHQSSLFSSLIYALYKNDIHYFLFNAVLLQCDIILRTLYNSI